MATGASVPGTGCVPAASATWRAFILSPKASSTSGGGPTNTAPAAATARANAGFSDRNPYPGCTARAPVRRTASTMASAFRYESFAGGGPTSTASSASPTCGASLSASE